MSAATPPSSLRLGDDVLDERRLAGRFRAVDLDDAPARDAADAERDVQRDRAGRDRLDGHPRVGLAQLHDRALAELPLDLTDGEVERLLLCPCPRCLPVVARRGRPDHSVNREPAIVTGSCRLL